MARKKNLPLGWTPKGEMRFVDTGFHPGDMVFGIARKFGIEGAMKPEMTAPGSTSGRRKKRLQRQALFEGDEQLFEIGVMHRLNEGEGVAFTELREVSNHLRYVKFLAAECMKDVGQEG